MPSKTPAPSLSSTTHHEEEEGDDDYEEDCPWSGVQDEIVEEDNEEEIGMVETAAGNKGEIGSTLIRRWRRRDGCYRIVVVMKL